MLLTDSSRYGCTSLSYRWSLCLRALSAVKRAHPFDCGSHLHQCQTLQLWALPDKPQSLSEFWNCTDSHAEPGEARVAVFCRRRRMDDPSRVIYWQHGDATLVRCLSISYQCRQSTGPGCISVCYCNYIVIDLGGSGPRRHFYCGFRVFQSSSWNLCMERR